MEKMPNKGVYTILLVVGFFLGVIWGILSLKPYGEMKAAIARGDHRDAWENAKKIRLYVIIGLIINVFVIFLKLGGV